MSVTLPTDTILFYGSPQQAKPQVLYGTIKLCVHKPISPRALYVKVTGESIPGNRLSPYQFMPPDNHSNIEHKVFLSHKELIFEHNPSTITLNPGNYEFDFCIKFDPLLPETIYSEYGDITYRIKAVLVKGNISSKIKKTVPIYLRRLTNCSEGAVFLPKSIEVAKIISERVFIKLSSSSNCYSKGQVAEFSVSLKNICPSTIIKTLGISIVETLIFTDPLDSSAIQNKTKVIKAVEINIPSSDSLLSCNPSHFTSNSLIPISFDSSLRPTSKQSLELANYSDSEANCLPPPYESICSQDIITSSYNLKLEIPNSTTLLQHDLCNTIFTVYHRLRVYCIVNDNNIPKILSFCVPFYIVPEAYFNNLLNLPTYQLPKLSCGGYLNPPPFSESRAVI
ncbi:hypothetical protein BB561_000506 [Smittium simulii]|uniref:Arrestin-like N-terminal domain-containing protein n=1 Tax=Smittium simulii TaxID=133385 RepID=A0A2T9YYR6_9FUNG|nr:hypothetical protein BB561_000506 [Smittium simulii]